MLLFLLIDDLNNFMNYITQKYKPLTIFANILDNLNNIIDYVDSKLKPQIIGIIFSVLFLMSAILSLITFGVEGVPNNTIELFYKPKYFEFDNNEKVHIEFFELDRNIWVLRYNEYSQVFDMRGWLNSAKHIYYLMSMKLVLDAYNRNKFIPFSLPYGKTTSPVKKIIISFNYLNKKQKNYILSKNYKFKKTLYVRYRLRMCLKGTRGSNETNYTYHKILISECYKLK